MSRLTVRLFGYPQFLVDNIPTKVEGHKTLALAAYLAAETTRPGIARAQLAALLWSDCSQQQASAYLRQALGDFTKAAGDGWITGEEQSISLCPQADTWVDVTIFNDRLAQWKLGGVDSATVISLLNELVDLYQADFLAGFSLPDCPAYEDWQLFQAEMHRLHLAQALEALVQAYTTRKRYKEAVGYARRWLTADPFNEAAHQALMHLFARQGQHTAALRQFEALQKILADELGVEPCTETITLYEHIRDTAPPPTAGPAPPGGNPAPAASLRPSGTITFLFTDIEGSTGLWERHPRAMPAAFVRQEALIREAMAAHGGYIYKMIGDGFQVAFATAPAALAAALDAQRALHQETWGETGPIKVRMGLHTGMTEERGDDYVGPTLNRAGRLLNAGHGGQILLNQPTVELVREHLPPGVSLRSLGEHWLKDLLNPEHIYQAIAQDLAEDFPPLRTAGAQHISLPAQMTPFIGREDELARIQILLDSPDCRLISLVGIGGCGKTRLSIQAAAQSRAFPDGIYFVGLAPVNSLEQMLPAIAEGLKLAFYNTPGASLTLLAAQGQLLNYLAGKQLLLVLDNFEQLTSCADFLTILLDSAPRLKLIVTSRERLNLPCEWVLEIGGLAFPNGPGSNQADQFAAVQLFIKSAERAGRFSPNDSDWPAITHICQLVEGIPLGVEMAAAWTRTLSCAEVAAEIERDLDFLLATWHGLPERQRSLQAVFEHSWRLLSEKERRAFSRLSIFHGSFSRAAALEVAGTPLSLLTNLIDKSLVGRVSSGRFKIHPVLKQYAALKLVSDPALLAETQRCHAAYYSDWMREQLEQIKGSQQLAALSALRGEARDLYAAWETLVEQRDIERLQQCLPAAILFNLMNDRWVETVEFTHLLLEMLSWLHPAEGSARVPSPSPAGEAHPALLALTLAALRYFTNDYDHPERTIPYQSESLQIIQSLPDSQSKAFVLLLDVYGPGLLSSRELAGQCQQCQAIFQRQGDAWGSAMSQLIQGDILIYGSVDADLARACYQASLETFTRLGADWGRALCLNGLSAVEHYSGRLQEAFDLARQSLELFEQLDNQERTVQIRLFLASTAESLGNLDAAYRYYTANQTHYLRRGDEQTAKIYQECIATLGEKRVKIKTQPRNIQPGFAGEWRSGLPENKSRLT